MTENYTYLLNYMYFFAVCAVFTVPSRLAGIIIGKKGATSMGLEKTHGARVQVKRPTDVVQIPADVTPECIEGLGTGTTRVVITGQPAAVAATKVAVRIFQ